MDEEEDSRSQWNFSLSTVLFYFSDVSDLLLQNWKRLLCWSRQVTGHQMDSPEMLHFTFVRHDVTHLQRGSLTCSPQSPSTRCTSSRAVASWTWRLPVWPTLTSVSWSSVWACEWTIKINIISRILHCIVELFSELLLKIFYFCQYVSNSEN